MKAMIDEEFINFRNDFKAYKDNLIIDNNMRIMGEDLEICCIMMVGEGKCKILHLNADVTFIPSTEGFIYEISKSNNIKFKTYKKDEVTKNNGIETRSISEMEDFFGGGCLNEGGALYEMGIFMIWESFCVKSSEYQRYIIVPTREFMCSFSQKLGVTWSASTVIRKKYIHENTKKAVIGYTSFIWALNVFTALSTCQNNLKTSTGRSYKKYQLVGEYLNSTENAYGDLTCLCKGATITDASTSVSTEYILMLVDTVMQEIIKQDLEPRILSHKISIAKSYINISIKGRNIPDERVGFRIVFSETSLCSTQILPILYNGRIDGDDPSFALVDDGFSRKRSVDMSKLIQKEVRNYFSGFSIEEFFKPFLSEGKIDNVKAEILRGLNLKSVAAPLRAERQKKIIISLMDDMISEEREGTIYDVQKKLAEFDRNREAFITKTDGNKLKPLRDNMLDKETQALTWGNLIKEILHINK